MVNWNAVFSRKNLFRKMMWKFNKFSTHLSLSRRLCLERILVKYHSFLKNIQMVVANCFLFYRCATPICKSKGPNRSGKWSFNSSIFFSSFISKILNKQQLREGKKCLEYTNHSLDREKRSIDNPKWCQNWIKSIKVSHYTIEESAMMEIDRITPNHKVICFVVFVADDNL